MVGLFWFVCCCSCFYVLNFDVCVFGLLSCVFGDLCWICFLWGYVWCCSLVVCLYLWVALFVGLVGLYVGVYEVVLGC